MSKAGFWGFVAGAIIGAGAAWYFTRDYYKGTVIATIKEDSKKATKKAEELVQVAKEASEKAEKKVKEAYNNIISKNSYSQFYADKKEEVKPINSNVASPNPEAEIEYQKQKEENPFEYISPEDYGENPDWSTMDLTYYKDGYLVDDLNNIIDDIDGSVGPDFMNHFGEYAENMAFIRNNLRECDYEIMAINQNFTDIFGN